MLLVLTVALVMAALTVVMAAPTFAAIGPPPQAPEQGQAGFAFGISHAGKAEAK
jgi:hypothetical protein